MSMIGNLFRVTTKELDEILKDSSILQNKLDSAYGDNAGNFLDIDKSWEAIFYLLTGHPLAEIEEAKPPLAWILFSGQLVDEQQDMGYGPACYISTEQVSQLSKALDGVSLEDLRQKFDGKEMNRAGVYPEVWDEPESLEYVLSNFEQLKDFYKIAEKEKMAVITFIS
jgi:hypothetical protein